MSADRWTYRGSLGPQSVPWLKGPCAIEDATTGRQIAILSGFRDDEQVRKARLIAAAPMLLEAIESIASAIAACDDLSARIERAGSPPHTDFWHQSIYDAEAKVRASLKLGAEAIAQATGEKP